MKRTFMAATMAICLSHTVQAQEAVIGAKDGIIKVLLEANHWELAYKYLTKRYIQHNPNAVSGLQGVVDYFIKVRKLQATDIPAKLTTNIVSVVAEGDLVTVAYPKVITDPKDPSKVYTATWFDSWRFVDGKADEHWDPATQGN